MDSNKAWICVKIEFGPGFEVRGLIRPSEEVKDKLIVPLSDVSSTDYNFVEEQLKQISIDFCETMVGIPSKDL